MKNLISELMLGTSENVTKSTAPLARLDARVLGLPPRTESGVPEMLFGACESEFVPLLSEVAQVV